MKLSCASLRLEAGDRVTVRYRPASSMPLNNGEPWEVPDALHAQLGELHILSRPAVVARLLSQALSECLPCGATATRTDRAITQMISRGLAKSGGPCRR